MTPYLWVALATMLALWGVRALIGDEFWPHAPPSTADTLGFGLIALVAGLLWPVVAAIVGLIALSMLVPHRA